MRIGIDGRFWSQTGVGRYIREIVHELSLLDNLNQYVLFLMEEDYDQVLLPSNFKKVKTRIRWHTLAEQILLPLEYKRENLDVLFIPNFNVPVFYPGPFVTTIHDLTLLRTRTGQVTKLPYFLFVLKYIASAFIHYVAVHRSKKIFTVSKYVKDDLVRTYKINPGKILLTPNAVDSSFYRKTEVEVQAVLKKYGISKPYLFYVGNGCPHKNLWRLVSVFDSISGKYPDLSLILGGKKDFNYLKLEERCSTLNSSARIKFVGFIKEEDLSSLYSGAQAYISPSMYEGFGIQVLEAFACGCKVICSKTTSLPEVGGDLADYFDPYDERNMAEVIQASLRKDLPDFYVKALKRVNEFSWKTSAQAVFHALTTV